MEGICGCAHVCMFVYTNQIEKRKKTSNKEGSYFIKKKNLIFNFVHVQYREYEK